MTIVTEMPKEKTSISWTFFTKNAEDTHAVCNICGRRIKPCGGPSNLTGHLRSMHKADYDQAVAVAQAPAQEEAVDQPMAGHSRDHYQLVKMIAKDLQPFKVVEDEGFKDFVKYLMPSFNMPSRKFISKTLIPAIYREVKMKLQRMIDDARCIACTTDLWTSRTQTPYVTVTAHFIESNQLRSAVLSSKPFPGSHTSERLAEALEEILQEWQCRNKVEAFVTDNGPNVVAAISITRFRQLGCIAHTINLLVRDAIRDVPELENLLQLCRAIVTFFRSSNVANDMLKEMQRLLNKEDLALIKPVSTRWFSDLHMVRRIIEVSDSLTMAQYRLASDDVRTRSRVPEPITASQMKMLQDYVLALEPFEIATTDLSGDKYPTASMIVPEVMGLHEKVAEIRARTDEGSVGRSFVDALMARTSERLFQYESSAIGRASTFLDPRFKKHGFRVGSNYESAKVQVEAELRRIFGEATVEEPAQEPLPGPNHGFGLLETVKNRVEASKNNARPASDALIAIDQYIKRPNKPLKEDVIKYWTDRPVDGEKMSQLAERYMVVPATSVPSERVFSTAGQVIAERRCRLKPEKAGMLIFLKQNTWLY